MQSPTLTSEDAFRPLKESLSRSLIVHYNNTEAYIPLGYLSEGVESAIVITLKNPNLFDVSYGYHHESSDQKIIESSLTDVSLDDTVKFINNYI